MKVNPRRPPQYIDHAQLKGAAIIASTWVVVFGSGYFILKSAWTEPSPESYSAYEAETGWPIRSYHVLLLVMMPTVVCVWATIAWIGMKFFRNG